MNWFLLAFLGTMLNGAGLCFFAQSIIRKTLEPGALNGSKRTTFAERTDPRDVQSVIVAMAKYKAIDAPFDAKDLFDPSVLPRR